MKKTPSDTAKCYDKILDPKGTDYDGDVSTTVSGRTCQVGENYCFVAVD